MPMSYRRPGVYLEESLLVNPAEAGATATVAAFVGAAPKGQINEPVLVQSWSDYVTLYGGFDLITPPTPSDPNDQTGRLGGQDFANLNALKADPVLGDGDYAGPPFSAGEYVRLVDDSQAHYLVPTLATAKDSASNGDAFATEATVLASDQENANKLAGLGFVADPTTPWTAGQGIWVGAYTFTWGVTTYTVSNKALTANVATLTVGPHGFAIGEEVTVALEPADAVFDGPQTITAMTSTTISFAKTNANVAVATTAGTVASEPKWVPATLSRNNGTWQSGAYPGDPKAIPTNPQVLSYLPYAIYSFFQNGGRMAWILRSAPIVSSDAGSEATIPVNGSNAEGDPLRSFNLNARSVGKWGNNLKYALTTQTAFGSGATAQSVFALQIIQVNSEGVDEVLETFQNLSMTGDISGSRRIDAIVNDPYVGSRYIYVADINTAQGKPKDAEATSLVGGTDPGIPDGNDMQETGKLVTKVEGPINLNIVGYMRNSSSVDTPAAANDWISASLSSDDFPDREDIFVVNDIAPPRTPGKDSATYMTEIEQAFAISTPSQDSYVGCYSPWIIMPHPNRIGTTMSIPPGGAIIGMMARIDATIGVFRAPAGMIAGLTNAVGVQTKFTDSQLGMLNNGNINIIRPIVGAGMCVMGGRTRKNYGADHYINARRVLIYIKEALRRNTQFAVFENNDHRLWSALRQTADSVLRPLWEQGGLRGASSAQAYFIRCDETLNNLQVIASGEVRMEVGVALEYPAEFVIIRITQYDRGTFTTEVQPAA